jgi:hypothetical protein
MYLSGFDMVAIMIALISTTTLVITSALANARLTRKVNQLRAQLASK